MDNFDDAMYEDDEFAEKIVNPSQPSSEPPQSGDNQPPVDEPPSQPSQQANQEDDITAEVLRLKGIKDPNKIKFEDTSGAVVERAWDSLSRDEQIRILGDVKEEAPANIHDQLDDSEIDLINSIRNSGMNVQDYLNSITPTVQAQSDSPQIDKMSDEDLYAFDILNKVGSDNITDEELDAAIEQAKSNDKLFKKTVEGLRADYLRREQENQERLVNEQQFAQQQRYNAFANVVNGEIANFDSFGGQDLRLSNDEKDELHDFMLNLDENGVSALGKSLQNPQVLTQVAFWLLNGDKVMEEMQKQTKDAYTRGYNAGKGGANLTNSFKSKLVHRKPQPQSKQDYNWDEDWD